jgi:hypothetical protein
MNAVMSERKTRRRDRWVPHVQPESKPGEYRRVAIADLTESQARDLLDRLGDVIADWDSETAVD